jgi:hypothetical protein
MLSRANAGVLGFAFCLSHSGPNIAPNFGKVKGVLGKVAISQLIEIIELEKLRKPYFRFQGLVGVPPWEFESPLRHQNKIKGLAQFLKLADPLNFTGHQNLPHATLDQPPRMRSDSGSGSEPL